MKHIRKDYKVETYTPRESANQNVAIVGENEEDQAVPSVMKLTEKFTDVEVVTAFHGGEFQNEPSHRSSTCRHTDKVVEKIAKDSQSPTASCERTGCEECLKARPSSEPVDES